MGEIIRGFVKDERQLPPWARDEIAENRDRIRDLEDEKDELFDQYIMALDAACDAKWWRNMSYAGLILSAVLASMIFMQTWQLDELSDQRDCLMHSSAVECGL